MLVRIGTLSAQTGVPGEVLRAWERRYGVVTPQRTAGGFRLYSEEDVARIRHMKSLIAGGLSASEAARHLLEDQPGASATDDGGEQTTLAQARSELHGALRTFDELALAASIDFVLSRLDLDTAIRDVFLPELRMVGEDWVAGRVSIAQEHFSMNLLRGRLMGLARGWDQGFGPRALLACPPGEHHDVSLILFGLALHRRGWRVTFLGADTPMTEVLSAGRSLSPRLTVLFAADWGGQAGLIPELSKKRRVSLCLAGATAGPIAAASGCRWLSGDPVSEAAALTREVPPQPGNPGPAVSGR